jgi:type IV pilus assembly protein PilQ
LLGDVPFLGHLFKSTVRTVSKTELLIFITPKIVSEGAVAR